MVRIILGITEWRSFLQARLMEESILLVYSLFLFSPSLRAAAPSRSGSGGGSDCRSSALSSWGSGRWSTACPSPQRPRRSAPSAASLQRPGGPGGAGGAGGQGARPGPLSPPGGPPAVRPPTSETGSSWRLPGAAAAAPRSAGSAAGQREQRSGEKRRRGHELRRREKGFLINIMSFHFVCVSCLCVDSWCLYYCWLCSKLPLWDNKGNLTLHVRTDNLHKHIHIKKHTQNQNHFYYLILQYTRVKWLGLVPQHSHSSNSTK